MDYDLVIPVAPKDVEMLPHCLAALHHLSPQPEDIYLVTPKAEPVEEVLKEADVKANVVLDTEVFDFAGKAEKPSWYQQVVKLFQTFSRSTYLVLDADTVLLQELRLFDGTGRILLGRFDFAGEPNEYYRQFMDEAFGLEPAIPKSLVSHHMVFQRSICHEMLSEFLLRHPNPNGTSDVEWFYDWLVEKGKDYEGYVSEYEAYGQLVLGRHRTIYDVREIATYEFTCYGGLRDIETNVVEHFSKAKAAGAAIMTIHKRDGSIKREWNS